jgi:hypothetical protein
VVIRQVASLGAYLDSRGVIAMSFAPRDSHEAQVQFALERGVPAFIGVLGSVKLPFPSSSFDMAHCSRCLIPWSGNGEAALDRSPVQCSAGASIHACHCHEIDR